MRRQLSTQNLGKTYREFSRQRYNKYKHQYPRMRESEVVLKIIKQWESMSLAQKTTLSQKYQAAKYLKEDQNKRSEATAEKSTAHKVEAITHTPSPLSKTNLPTINVYPPLFPYRREEDADSQFNKNSVKYSQDQKSQRSSYSITVAKAKTNKNEETPTKHRNNQKYIRFYKYNYSKIIEEHPNWTAAQVSHIIKLQWKKKNTLKKAASSQKIKFIKKKLVSNISGRMFFKKYRELTWPQCKLIWKRKPNQGKRIYKQRAKGQIDYIQKRSNISNTMVLKPQPSPLSFLFKV